MSSGNAANRAPRGGDGADYFASPAWTVRAVLPYLRPDLAPEYLRRWLSQARILEPSAGDGAIVRVLIEAGADPRNIMAVEPDPGRSDAVRSLGVRTFNGTVERWADGVADRFDLCILNPPYSLAESHIRIACSLLAPSGTCAALVRLAFLAEAQERRAFRQAHPHDRLELIRRPSFTAERLSSLTDSDLFAMATPEELAEAERRAAMPRAHKMTLRERTIAIVRARLMRTDSAAYAWGLFGAARGGRFWTHEEES